MSDYVRAWYAFVGAWEGMNNPDAPSLEDFDIYDLAATAFRAGYIASREE